MAANDLTKELLSPQMEPTLNDAISQKVVEAVLNTLQDKNGEVQNMGVKWYSQFMLQYWTVVYRHWFPNWKNSKSKWSLTDLRRLRTRQIIMPSYAIYPRLVGILSALILTLALRTVIIEIPGNTRLSHILISRLLPRLQSQVHMASCFTYP